MKDDTIEQANKALVAAAFERWKQGAGSPFDLLHPDVQWTIVGSSPLSKTYTSKKQFYDECVDHFAARLATPAVPAVKGMYADGDTVIIHYDADAMGVDGIPYHNTYAWFLEMKDGQVVKGTAFFDTRFYDALWDRIQI